MVKACVLITTGTEPSEAIVPIDFMLRAKIEVTTAACGTSTTDVTLDPYVKMTCDTLLDSIKGQLFDLVLVPGGDPGTANLANNADVVAFVKAHFEAGKFVAAICAAPGMVLADKCHIVSGKTACGYPGTDDLITANGGKKSLDKVVVDGKLITSRGPGTACVFGIEIVRQLCGEDTAKQIHDGMLVY